MNQEQDKEEKIEFTPPNKESHINSKSIIDEREQRIE